MIRIAHLTSVHPSNDIRIFHKECQTLVNAGYNVTLIAPMVADCQFSMNGVNLIGVRQIRGRLKRFALMGIRLGRVAWAHCADVYHVHDPELLLLGIALRVRGKTVIFDMHENLPKAILSKEWIPPVLRPALSRAIRMIERLLLFRTSVIFAESSYGKDYKWIKRSTVVLNMPLVDELLRIHVPKSATPAVGYMGVVSESRGSMQILRALSALRSQGVNMGWECVGRMDDSIASRMTSFVQSERLRDVNFHGFMDPKEAWAIIAQCHVGVAILDAQPNYVESLPTKLFEYMALGLPVIVSNFPLYEDVVVNEKCGISIDPGNLDQFVDALLYLIRNPGVAREMGEAGRAAVIRKYNWGVEKLKLLAFYRNIVGAPVQRPSPPKTLSGKSENGRNTPYIDRFPSLRSDIR